MKKYLLTIEFRYGDVPRDGEELIQYIRKTITIGVFNTRDEANLMGNSALEVFEGRFKLNPNYNKKERFSNNGGCFGNSKDLVTNLAYLQVPFDFYAKITELKYCDINTAISDAIDAGNRLKSFKQ